MNKLGIIAGSGKLPQMIAEAFEGEAYIVALKNYAEKESFTDHSSEEFAIGSVGKILKYFKSNNVENLIIAGSVKRFSFKDIAVDLEGAALMAKIMAAKFLGDDKLLRIAADYIESKGFSILPPLEYIKNNDVQTHKKPNKNQFADIEYAIKSATELGKLDIGQGVIVEKGLILGVEAAEGTDQLIERCASYAKESKASILIKMMKPNQDKRLDVPVIGKETILNAIRADMAGIAIQEDSVIIIDKEEIVEIANQNKFFIHLFC